MRLSLRVAATLACCLGAATAQDAPEPIDGDRPAAAASSAVGEFASGRMKVRLELFADHGFAMTVERADRTLPEWKRVQFHSTRPQKGVGRFRWKFDEESGPLAENDDYTALAYRYAGAGRPDDGITIIVNIKALSVSTRADWYVDRIPFCRVFIGLGSDYAAFPLDRKGTPEGKRCQRPGPIPFEHNARFGYRDPTDTRVVIPPRFSSADRFRGGLALVGIDGGGYGFIDTKGKFVIEPRFGYCRGFGENGVPELAMVTLDGKAGMVDRSGKLVIPTRYEQIGAEMGDDIIAVYAKRSAGYIHRSGRVIREPTFEGGLGFREGRAAVRIAGRWGFLDTTGKIVISPRYKRAYGFYGGRAAVQVRNGKWGYIDRTGTLAIPAQFDRAANFDRGYTIVAFLKADRHVWGCIDKTGKLFIPARYTEIGRFHRGRAYAELGDKVGWLYRDGRFEERN